MEFARVESGQSLDLCLLSIPQECFMQLYCILYLCPSVCLAAFMINDNSRMSRRGIVKLCTNILDVSSNMEMEDGSRT